MHSITLQNLGLSQEEVRIYSLLSTSRPLTATTIANTLKYTRPLAYKLLAQLITHGLVKKIMTTTPSTFTLTTPDALLHIAQQRLNSLTTQRQSLTAILPILKARYHRSTERPIIETYETTEAIKAIYEDSLASKSKRIVFVRPRLTSGYKRIFGRWFSHFLIKQSERNLISSAITPDDPTGNHDQAIDHARRIRRTWVHLSDYTTNVELKSWDDRLSIINFAKQPHGVLIKHPYIAKAFQEFFALAKRGAETITVPHDHA